jgi:shikimate kinase
MKTSIALIGFMGAGKSAVGGVLAERLGKQFVETDSMIEKKAGKPVPAIFKEQGEIAFREMEIEVIKEISGRDHQVIACGGGVVLNKINIDRLKLKALVVWLTASPSVILKRTGLNGEERPVLKQVNNLDELNRLIQFRKPFYQRAADLKVDTSRLDIPATVEQIIKKMENHADSVR